MITSIFCSMLTQNIEHYPIELNPLQWNNLLHINDDNISEIHDPTFFLTPTHSPIDELNEHIRLIKTDKKCETICKFPARYTYLNKVYDLNLSFNHCQDLQRFYKDMYGDSISLVFASSYLGSPMSFFGHTFLKINKKNDYFFSKTLSYTAEVPQNTNFLSLVSKGISGGFDGQAVISPYFKLIEGYNSIEQRSLTEYELNLTKDEIDQIIYHSYELINVKIPYRFLSDNCAYEMLWYLDIAKPDLNLHQQYHHYTIPFETVSSIKEKGLVKEILRQNASLIFYDQLYSLLNDSQDTAYHTIMNSSDKKSALANIENKELYVALLHSYYDFMFKRFNRGLSDYNEVKSLETSLYNRRINITEDRKQFTSKILLGKTVGKNFNDDLIFIPMLSNRYYDHYDKLSESSLEALKLHVTKQHDSTRIESFDILNIESFNRNIDFYKPISWEARFAFDRSINDQLQPNLKIGMGKTFGSENFIGYALLESSLHANTIGLSYIAGISYWSNQTHIGLDINEPIAYTSFTPKKKQKLFLSQPLTEKLFLHLAYDCLRENTIFQLGIRF